MMAEMGMGYGSECHLLRYLGRHRQALDAAVMRVTGAQAVSWLDHPFDASSVWKDGEHKGLSFLPDGPIMGAWREFWPQRGNPPNWDAVGQLTTDNKTEWLLVEAKAHIAELASSCKASADGGLAKIRRALDATKRALGVAEDRDWLNGHYQFCNRLAVLHFLHSNGVPARLLFIYFVGDRFRAGQFECPSKPEDWKQPLEAVDQHVGLPAGHSLTHRVHRLHLPVC